MIRQRLYPLLAFQAPLKQSHAATRVAYMLAGPSTSAPNLAHVTDGWTLCTNDRCAKPQSVLPIRLSRPTSLANRERRSATSSGCSTTFVAALALLAALA